MYIPAALPFSYYGATRDGSGGSHEGYDELKSVAAETATLNRRSICVICREGIRTSGLASPLFLSTFLLACRKRVAHGWLYIFAATKSRTANLDAAVRNVEPLDVTPSRLARDHERRHDAGGGGACHAVRNFVIISSLELGAHAVAL